MDLENITFIEKIILAENLSTPGDILEELAKDNANVRWRVAENPSTSIDVLCKLAKDDSQGIRESVALNPKASSKILVILFEYEKSLNAPAENVIKALYTNNNLPAFAKRVIETLYGDML